MAVYQEFTIDQGSDATIELHLVDKNGAAKDLTGYTVTARLKKNYSDRFWFWRHFSISKIKS